MRRRARRWSCPAPGPQHGKPGPQVDVWIVPIHEEHPRQAEEQHHSDAGTRQAPEASDVEAKLEPEQQCQHWERAEGRARHYVAEVPCDWGLQLPAGMDQN